MPLYIGQDLYGRFLAKLKLSVEKASSFILGQTVVPVLSVENPVITRRIIGSSATITATGYVALQRVPVGKRWTLVAARATTGAAKHTYNSFLIGTDSSNLTMIKEFTSANNIKYYPSDGPCAIESKWYLFVYVDAYTADAAINYEIVVLEESGDFGV